MIITTGDGLSSGKASVEVGSNAVPPVEINVQKAP